MTRLLPLLALVWAAGASAQVAYGGPLPLATTPYPSVDGSSTTLDAQAGRAGLVVVFWSAACPWTDRYAPRLADLVEGYAPAGVGFALVDARPVAGATGPAAGVALPTLTDADGALAAAFGATSTPHAFFFGPDRTLLYSGAIDDSPASPARVQVPYLAQAMDQSVAGLPVEVQKTQAFGCTIRRTAE